MKPISPTGVEDGKTIGVKNPELYADFGSDGICHEKGIRKQLNKNCFF
jgi:hypothetical protein